MSEVKGPGLGVVGSPVGGHPIGFDTSVSSAQSAVSPVVEATQRNVNELRNAFMGLTATLARYAPDAARNLTSADASLDNGDFSAAARNLVAAMRSVQEQFPPVT